VTDSRVICSGCGYEAPPDDPFPFRCPNRGDGADHVMTRVLHGSAATWPSGGEANPFVRYRTLAHSYHLARRHGMPDDRYVELVGDLDRAVAEVDGHGFTVSPFAGQAALAERVGVADLWVKDETGNVSGSHKGRHLMGLLILLEVAERTGLAGRDPGRPLAIASCGNAALAAAVVARAGRRPLDVFVPTWAEPAVLARLEDLGARINVVPRQDGVAGDPTYHALQAGIAEGAFPFTCQGPDNGLTVEGGMTLGYEIADGARGAGESLDRLFVQVGGGALASALVQGLREAATLGALDGLPRIHAVQTRGAHPLARAYGRLANRILDRLGEPASLAGTAEGADRIREKVGAPEVEEELSAAARDRRSFMWPWETEPASVASGILDDETYDWLAVVRGMVETGGFPVLVSEETLETGNVLARDATGIDVDHTGSAGLAGLLEVTGAGEVDRQERVAVLFTGIRR
jgi:threonine synthase